VNEKTKILVNLKEKLLRQVGGEWRMWMKKPKVYWIWRRNLFISSLPKNIIS